MCSLYRCSFHLLDLISQKGEEGGGVGPARWDAWISGLLLRFLGGLV